MRTCKGTAPTMACRLPRQILNFFTQIHEAAAFCIDGQAGPGLLFQVFHKPRVGRQTIGLKLGVAAPQVKAVETRRQLGVDQRGKFHQFSAEMPQPLQVLGVIKAEGLVPGHP